MIGLQKGIMLPKFVLVNQAFLKNKSKIHQSTHKILPEGPILSHLKPVYTHIHSLTHARTRKLFKGQF
jgi:hypothetical protein